MVTFLLKGLVRHYRLCTLTLCALGGILWGGQRYLASRRVADQVAAHLSALLDMPVRVGRVHVGWGSTALDRLELFQPGDAAGARPWATVAEVDVQAPAWQLLSGHALLPPLTLKGAVLTFRLTRQGHVVTRPPQGGIIRSLPRHPEPRTLPPALPQVPDVHIEDGRVLLRQDGRDDVRIEDIQADVTGAGDQLQLTGRVTDPTWGDWAVTGAMNRATLRGSADLATRHPVQVTPAKLNELPFSARRVGDDVRLCGPVSARLHAHWDLAAQTVHYGGVLDPRGVALAIPAIGLAVHGAHGEVTVRDEVVRLHDVRGDAADGEVAASGEVRFTPDVVRMGLAVRVRGVAVQRLPPQWNLPAEVRGRLTGHAELQTTVEGDTAFFRGTGRGVIRHARVEILPVGSLPLVMRADRDGFRFALATPTSATQPRAGRPGAADLFGLHGR